MSQNETAVIPGGPFRRGLDPRRGRSGGRPASLVEIQKLLDEEHRSVDRMREVFDRLRALAMGEVVELTFRGQPVGLQLRADPRFMALYLDRVIGPVTNQDAVRGLAKELLAGMIAEARQQRAAKPEGPESEAGVIDTTATTTGANEHG